MDNKQPILFRPDSEEYHEITPQNGNAFFASEVFDILDANDLDDLDRIEVYNGALYCIELRDNLAYNRTATSFWRNNAAYLNRRHGILGLAIFIPHTMDIYEGMDTIQVE